MFELDVSTFVHGLSSPGIDPRMWGSYGIVNADTAESRSVLFDDPETGNPLPFPLVLVTLQPSGITVPCRVGSPSSGAAGNGEGEWEPFVEGDEVFVLIPEGHERSGCVIALRFNQDLDKWPRQVAGQDSTKNSFGFRRQRPPYLFETSSSWLVRGATAGSFLSMSTTGTWTMTSGDKHVMRLGPDFVGFNTGDNTGFMQLVPGGGSVKTKALIQGDAAQLVVDGTASSLLTPGTFGVATAGNSPLEHVTTIEAVVNLFAALGAALTALGAAPLTGTSLGAVLVGPPFAAIIAAASVLGLSTTSIAALTTALAVPKGPNKPGVGCPGFTVG